MDKRLIKQAGIIVNYSLKVKKGENVAIYADIEAKPLVLELYRQLIEKGANEIKLHLSSYEFAEVYFKNASDEQLRAYPKIDDYEIKHTDCYIGISSSQNTRALSSIDAAKLSLRTKTTKAISDYRVEKTRWVLTRYPTEAFAQEADMSLADYSKFVFKAINSVDWKKLRKKQQKLARLLTNTVSVRIIGPGTDLVIMKKDRRAINAAGEFNLPDGEVFTSVEESKVNGSISYTYPAIYMGREFQEVYLEFKEGRVVKAKALKGSADLNKILDMDSGSRFVGELGIGNNYQIKHFTKDILFDEKIGGSVHIALGKGYKETGSKNNSALHWDMIKDLRKGGELWFDNKLVQKNGKWGI